MARRCLTTRAARAFERPGGVMPSVGDPTRLHQALVPFASAASLVAGGEQAANTGLAASPALPCSIRRRARVDGKGQKLGVHRLLQDLERWPSLSNTGDSLGRTAHTYPQHSPTLRGDGANEAEAETLPGRASLAPGGQQAAADHRGPAAARDCQGRLPVAATHGANPGPALTNQQGGPANRGKRSWAIRWAEREQPIAYCGGARRLQAPPRMAPARRCLIRLHLGGRSGPRSGTRNSGSVAEPPRGRGGCSRISPYRCPSTSSSVRPLGSATASTRETGRCRLQPVTLSQQAGDSLGVVPGRNGRSGGQGRREGIRLLRPESSRRAALLLGEAAHTVGLEAGGWRELSRGCPPPSKARGLGAQRRGSADAPAGAQQGRELAGTCRGFALAIHAAAWGVGWMPF